MDSEETPTVANMADTDMPEMLETGPLPAPVANEITAAAAPAPLPNLAELTNEETVNTTTSDGLPLLCWFCNKEFPSFTNLSEHMKEHQQQAGDGKGGRRHRRCPRCGEVLPSMWKLRQHLSQHGRADVQGGGQAPVATLDHVYAEKNRSTRALK